MARNQLSQRQRTAQNPFPIGSFAQTSVRYLRGKLGPTNQVVNGGYGGNTYNHWFKFTLNTPGWIITAKGGDRSKHINLSAYDLNRNPIQARNIFQEDSIATRDSDGNVAYPYAGSFMGATSDFYNTFNAARLDRGNELYFTLNPGDYMLCISNTRNELIDYAIGIVIEIADPIPLLLLEDFSRILYEDTVEVSAIQCDLGPEFTGATEHEHSLSEWQTAWDREHTPDNPFPQVLVPLATRP